MDQELDSVPDRAGVEMRALVSRGEHTVWYCEMSAVVFFRSLGCNVKNTSGVFPKYIYVLSTHTVLEIHYKGSVVCKIRLTCVGRWVV